VVVMMVVVMVMMVVVMVMMVVVTVVMMVVVMMMVVIVVVVMMVVMTFLPLSSFPPHPYLTYFRQYHRLLYWHSELEYLGQHHIHCSQWCNQRRDYKQRLQSCQH
jgi:ABC-type transport system involved in cytochrome bd biosynthesis fused ATPase/permease subunit